MKKLFALFALFASFSAFAFTPAQLNALKALAVADPVAAEYVNNPSASNDLLLANWFNGQSTFVVWKTSLDPDSMRQGVIDGASQLDNLTVGKRDALLYLFSGALPNTAALRSAIEGLCWTQNQLKASLAAQMYRNATRAEGALASGTGTVASPGTLVWEGNVSQGDASQIRSQ